MQLKSIVRSLIAGVGVVSIGIAGCTQARKFEATSPTAPSTSNSPSADQAQAVSTPEAQAPNRSPDVVYVPTPTAVVNEMLRRADVKSNDVVYDLGSGDGRIVIAAAQQRGVQLLGCA